MKFLSFIALLFSFLDSQGQQELGVSEGLTGRNVSCVLQTRDGLMWFATANGLNSYDGYKITQYHTFSQGIHLSNSRVNYMAEDPSGNLWVATGSGLDIIPSDRSKSTHIKGLENTAVSSLLLAKNNRMLAGTRDGKLYMIDANQKAHILFTLAPNVAILGLRKYAGYIWFYSNFDDGIYRLTEAFQPDSSLHFPQHTFGQFASSGNNLLVPTREKKGLLKFDGQTGRQLADPFYDSLNRIHGPPIHVMNDNNTHIWASYGQGKLLCIDTSTRQVKDYSSLFPLANFGSLVQYIYEDRSQLIWAATDDGLIKISGRSIQFGQLLHGEKKTAREWNISTRAMLEDRHGNIYVGSYNGLFYVNTTTGHSERYLVQYPKALMQPNPFDMLWLDSTHILIASQTEGLLIFNTIKKIFEFPYKNYSGAERQLHSLFRDPQGLIWIGGNTGLMIYNPITGSVNNKMFNPGHLLNKSIWYITSLGKNKMLFGTLKGLVITDLQLNIERVYDLHSNPALLNEEITYIRTETDHIIWLGSRGGGLMRIDYNQNQLTSYTTANGLSNNTVYAAIEDQGYLWISTDHGISRMNIKNRTFHTYFEKDGIADNECNAHSFLVSRSGMIYIGSINGVTCFNPGQMNGREPVPELFFTSIVKNDQEHIRLKQPELHEVYVELPYTDNYLSVGFALADYDNPKTNYYEYKIVGLEEGWHSLEGQNFLRLNQLPSGNFCIVIRGRNAGGTYSSNQLQINVSVARVFYKHTWFWILILILVSIIIYLLFRIRINQLLKMQQMRTRISSDLHDEVGSMLTRISILTEQAKYKHKQVPEMEQIAQASRQATATMSDVLWSVDGRNDKLGNLIDRMREHADKLLSPLEMIIHFEVGTLDSQYSISMQKRRALLLIFKEAINNVARHSSATEITILVHKEQHILIMEIQDNGVGGNKEGTGQGLRNMQMRAEEVGGSLEIYKKDGYRLVVKVAI